VTAAEDFETVRKGLASIPKEHLVEPDGPSVETHTLIRSYEQYTAEEALTRILAERDALRVQVGRLSEALNARSDDVIALRSRVAELEGLLRRWHESFRGKGYRETDLQLDFETTESLTPAEPQEEPR